ncbi:MAG: iron-containing alcohol dehydrogenase, partial [Candidatus Marinimicrobia bacterium]|nr:iron-containing alcohol dehydrogenase [Candidatus Neomarinimicrobiota bacterium]
LKAKTGIVSRHLRPSQAIVDPDVTRTLPAAVVAASGFDVLSHALESYTARPYTRRPAAAPPSLRPQSQGANPWSDIGCLESLRLVGENLVRAVTDAGDHEARGHMMFAATLAGIAFGNAGCHLPHGMSYSVSGLVRDFQPEGYPDGEPIVPHGFSVIVNAPSVFRFTAQACPERHLRAAECLGGDTAGAGTDDAGVWVVPERRLAGVVRQRVRRLVAVVVRRRDIQPGVVRGQQRVFRRAVMEPLGLHLRGVEPDALLLALPDRAVERDLLIKRRQPVAHGLAGAHLKLGSVAVRHRPDDDADQHHGDHAVDQKAHTVTRAGLPPVIDRPVRGAG